MVSLERILLANLQSIAPAATLRRLRHIGADHPIYGLQSRHLTEPEFIPQTVEEMAADYLDHIRKI
jgi:thioesterase domain-containing protein